MGIQVHVDDELGRFLDDVARGKGISLSNEVGQRLGASLRTSDDAELLVEHIAKALCSAYLLGGPISDWRDLIEYKWREWLPTARAILSYLPDKERSLTT